MQVISFFSAKGGTGKSTFNMLLASYLKYVLGKRGLVLDLDAPGYNFSSTREREADGILQENPSFDANNLYPIRKIEDLSRSHIKEEIADLRNLEEGYDYVVIDCSIASSYSLGEVCKNLGQPFLLFFNKVYWQEKKELYAPE